MTKGIKYSVAEGHPNGLKLRIITLTAAVLVAFFIRMLSYASVTANGGITLSGYDQFIIVPIDYFYLFTIFP